METDLLTRFLNFAIPPIAVGALVFLLPPFYFFKPLFSFLSSFFPENVNNKVVLITGASSGIGEEMAYEYARRGALLALAARREQSLKEVAENARDLGSPDVIVVQADVAKLEDCRRLVEAAVNHFGRLDHLVNNAGIAHLSVFEEAGDVTNLRPVMDINFWGAVYATHYAIPHLKRSNGRIVVTSSSAGWTTLPRMSVYNASKAALTSFYETLRTELGSDVGVTIATPGWIESEMTKGKFLSKEGVLRVDQEMRDVQVGLMPVESTAGCAKAIVDGACRGRRHVIEPAWFWVIQLWKVLLPEAVEWWMRFVYVASWGGSRGEVLSKKVLDATGLKGLLYPSSVNTPEIKKL